MKTKYLILGGGLAGLSASWHLRQEDYLLVEKEAEIGGLCRSYQLNDFTFDYTGHLLHFRQPEIREWIVSLMHNQLVSHDRKAYIFSNRVYTPYPFQANLCGLPREVIKECLTEFIYAWQRKSTEPEVRSAHFEEWILRTLGQGIAKHFMIPFNEKLWKRSLKEMTADWVSWLVPQPRLEEVINGTLGISNRPMGYNPGFLYPLKGGIQSLGNRIASELDHLLLNEGVEEIRTSTKEVLLKSGKSVEYQYLVSSLPLNVCLSKCVDLPKSLREKARRLEYISVAVVNLGIDRPNISDKHWIYFPEARFPFYRAGIPSNLSPHMAPDGTSSLSVEVSVHPSQKVNTAELLGQVKEGLYVSGLISKTDKVLVEDIRTISHAYVIYNHDYSTIVPELKNSLKSHDIYSIGRYGSWEHTSMEDALSQGKSAAREISRS